MSKRFSAASIYGIIDRMDADDVRRWLSWHQSLKYPPRFINVFTASRFNEAPNILHQVRSSLPDTTPVWRGFDGKDAWGNIPKPDMKWDDSNYYLRMWNDRATSARMAAGIWFERRVKPYLAVIRETGAIVMLLNEAAAVFNAPFEAECIRVLGEEGIRAAAFRWSAGTPDWPDYKHEAILAEVAMAEKYNALVGPHEYAGLTLPLQNSLINRHETLVKLFKKKPDVFIGEFGLALAEMVNGVIKLDPDAGWLEMGVSEPSYMGFIRDAAKVYYVPNRVSLSLFDWIGWGRNGSFGVGRYAKLLEGLELASEWMSFSVEDEPMSEPNTPVITILPRPPEATSGFRVKIKSFGGPQSRNLRASWNYMSADVGDVYLQTEVRRFDIPLRTGLISATASGKWCFVEVMDGEKVTASGWLWKDNIVWETSRPTQEVPVTPAPEPETPPVIVPDPTVPPPETMPDGVPMATVTQKRYTLEIKTTQSQHQLIEQSLMLLITGLTYLGQALGNTEVTIKTDVVVSP